MFKDIQHFIRYWKTYLLFTATALVIVFGMAMCAPEPDPSNYRNPNELMERGGNRETY